MLYVLVNFAEYMDNLVAIMLQDAALSKDDAKRIYFKEVGIPVSHMTWTKRVPMSRTPNSNWIPLDNSYCVRVRY